MKLQWACTRPVVKLGLSEGSLAGLPGSIPAVGASSLESIPYEVMPYLDLMQRGGGLILPQTNVPNCVDSPWESFLVERTEYFIFQIKIFMKE